MRSTVIITKRGPGYISSVSGKFGGGHQGARCGLTPYEAASTAARLMIEYAQSNPEGGDLMAPPEVLELVPEHLRSIPGYDTHMGEAGDHKGHTLRADDMDDVYCLDCGRCLTDAEAAEAWPED